MKGKLSRYQVALQLGVTPSYVAARFDGRELNPVYEGRRPFYVREEVTALKESWERKRRPKSTSSRATPGKLAAQAFQCFERGLSVTDTVIATEAPPELISDLWRMWTNPANIEKIRQERRAEAVADRCEVAAEREHARQTWILQKQLAYGAYRKPEKVPLGPYPDPNPNEIPPEPEKKH